MNLEPRNQLFIIYDLYRLGQRIALEEDPQTIQHQLLERIVDAFQADNGSLALVGEQGDLTIVAGIDLPAHVIGQSIALGSGIMGLVASEGQPKLLNGDLENDRQLSERRDTQHQARPPSSAMCWPLTVEREVIGVININRKDNAAPFTGEDLEQGEGIIHFIAIAVENARLHSQSIAHIEEQKALVRKLEEARNQLLQAEKMASIGQLAAGVAHEINNPVGYINSNLSSLVRYVDDLMGLLKAYEESEYVLAADAAVYERIHALKEDLDVEFLKDDMRELLSESQEGVSRVKNIVQDLKNFSHVDEAEWLWANIEKGLDSTLNIVHNELKYKAEVVREYAGLPEVECIPSQLNQVFMNLLVNAVHAITDHGRITVRTGQTGDDQVWVEIEDNGRGIDEEHLKRIFDPFFTTKPVGEGTGLGLSLSYGIVERHGGRIEVDSRVGEGTRFRVWLPCRHAAVEGSGN